MIPYRLCSMERIGDGWREAYSTRTSFGSFPVFNCSRERGGNSRSGGYDRHIDTGDNEGAESIWSQRTETEQEKPPQKIKINEKRSTTTHFSSAGMNFLNLLCVHLFFPSEVRLGFIKLLPGRGEMQPSLINKYSGGKDPLLILFNAVSTLRHFKDFSSFFRAFF